MFLNKCLQECCARCYVILFLQLNPLKKIWYLSAHFSIFSMILHVYQGICEWVSRQGVVDLLPNDSLLTIEVFIFQVFMPGIMSFDWILSPWSSRICRELSICIIYFFCCCWATLRIYLCIQWMDLFGMIFSVNKKIVFGIRSWLFCICEFQNFSLLWTFS